MSTLQKLSLEYVAGIVDGEGSIYITKSKPDSTHKNYSYGPKVAITSSYYPLLVAIHEQYNIGPIYKAKEAKNLNVFDIKETSPPKIIHFLSKILPYLLIKKQQAELMLKFLKERQTIKEISVKGKQGFRSVSIEEMHKRETYYVQMKTLNHPLRDSSSNRTMVNKE